MTSSRGTAPVTALRGPRTETDGRNDRGPDGIRPSEIVQIQQGRPATGLTCVSLTTHVAVGRVWVRTEVPILNAIVVSNEV